MDRPSVSRVHCVRLFTVSGCSLCLAVRGLFTGARAMQGRVSGGPRTASEPPRRCLARRRV
eukprot:3474744-Alexandrium_andersonii.AAC.1